MYLTTVAAASSFNFRDLYPNGSVVALLLYDGTTGVFEYSYGSLVYGAGGAATDSITSRVITDSYSGVGVPVAWGAGSRNAVCMVSARSFLLRENALGELTAPQVITARSHLGLLSAATMPASRFGLVDSGWTGGSNHAVVRLSTADTMVNASNTDTVDQLYGLAFKTPEGYYLSGSLVANLGALSAGTVYYLSTGGGLTSIAPTPSASVRRVVIGKACSTTSLLFQPGTPISG